MSPAVLNLEKPESWSEALRSYLDGHYDLFLNWEIGNGRVAAPAFDNAIYGLIDILEPYTITGWHCTRLTDVEIDHILRHGLQLPDTAMLNQRIDALVAMDHLTDDIASRLKGNNQSGDRNRAGMVWFCFYPPRIAGEHGIERFFRHWGGEALYNSHEDDPITSSAIRGIGTPCVVEADVPITSLEPNGGLVFKIYRRFLLSRGINSHEPAEHEDRIIRPLAAEGIRRVIQFPEAEFQSLTGCSNWNVPIDQP